MVKGYKDVLAMLASKFSNPAALSSAAFIQQGADAKKEYQTGSCSDRCRQTGDSSTDPQTIKHSLKAREINKK